MKPLVSSAVSVLILGSLGSEARTPVPDGGSSAPAAPTSDLRLGWPQSLAIESLGACRAARIGGASIGRALIEEWTVEPAGTDGAPSFFLYFLDDRLVAVSRQRVPFRDDAALLRQWRALVRQCGPQGAGSPRPRRARRAQA